MASQLQSESSFRSLSEKQLSNYMDFLKRVSLFQKWCPYTLTIWMKTFMMAHFNELNTQGIDRDEALALAIESERLVDFTGT